MRVLISGVGTRGDVQPVLALAVAMRNQGHQACLAISPNFVAWARELGFEAFPVGVEMRAPGKSGPAPVPAVPLEQLIGGLVSDQFTQLRLAAEGCDMIVGVGSYQFAAPSIAEWKNRPYLNAVLAPVSLPSPDLPPRPEPGQAWMPGKPADHRQLWDTYAQKWNARYLRHINQNRETLGLLAIADVIGHILGARPLLATDPLLGPAPETPGRQILTTGGWMLTDTEPLSTELEAFLLAGESPIYFGFGSMPVPPETGQTLLAAARKQGRRALLAQGWSEWDTIGQAPDCLIIGDVNQQALFPRVAAVVHHGGAGTTTAAARAGTPQVICPMFSDQFYWAFRVQELKLGAVRPYQGLSTESLAQALSLALSPEVRMSAQAFAARVLTAGAEVAAREISRRSQQENLAHRPEALEGLPETGIG